MNFVKKKLSGGFTLAEILVVIAIVAIVGTILVLIFTNTLRGSNKSQILSAMKQNGQAVLDSMSRTIRSADNVVCPASESSNTIVIVKNGTYSRYRVVLSTDIVGSAPASCLRMGSNGCIVFDNPTPSPSETIPQLFINRVCNAADSMSSAQILTDTNLLTGVAIDCIASDCITNPFFTRNKSAGFKDQVTVKFNLKPGVGAPPTIAGQIDPISFQTTVELR